MADDPESTPESSKVTRLPRRRPPPGPRVDVQPADVREQRAQMLLGDECPYTPLGLDEGHYYVIDRNLDVRCLTPRDLSRNMLVSICGEPWLEARHPRSRKGDKVYGIAAEKAAAELMNACSVMGRWNPDDHVRGLGAWIGADGDLVLHRGDHLFVRGQVQPLGRRGDHVYVPRRALPALPDPSKPRSLVASAAATLAGRLDSWRWARGTYDADLALGWICCAMLGAALRFRPHKWIVGEFQSGKTTLQLWLQTLFSAAGITSVTDTSAAGLWQRMAYDSLPVAIDEFESSAELERQNAVVRLLRQASSGALILRGGSSHSGAAFTVQSCFLCSGIIAPPLASQDASRIVTLELLKDPPGVRRPPFSVDQVAALGAALTRRLADNYARLVSEVMPAVRAAMMDDGFPARMADVYSALWATRDVAEHDEYAPARLEAWLAKQPTRIAKDAAIRELTPEWRRCLDWWLQTRVDRSARSEDTFGDLVTRGAIGMANPRKVMQGNLFDAAGDEVSEDDSDRDAVAARNRLARHGVRLQCVTDDAGAPQIVLLIANTHRSLGEVFQNTVWRTLPEAATGGGWSQVLRRAPGATVAREAVRFRGGVRSRAVVLPIELVIGDGDHVPPAPVTEDDEAEVYDLQSRKGPLH